MKSWPLVALGDVFEIARGGSPRPIDAYLTEAPGGVNWIMIGDAPEGSKYITQTKHRIRPEGVKRSRMVHPGDFLLTNSMSFGRPYIMRTAGCIHDGWLVLSKRADGIDQDFFFHLLGSKPLYAEFVRLAAGATVKNLNIALVKKVKVPFPPLPQQRRIAEVLDRAEALRAKKRAALAQLDTLTQSIFLEMFGDPVTNPKGWQRIRLGDHARKIGSGATPTGGEAAYKDSGIALIRSMNVRDGFFRDTGLAFIDEDQAAKLDGVVVEADDVLLNITGASVARVCRAPANVLPARVNQHVAIVRPTHMLHAVFLEQVLLSSRVRAQLLRIAGAGATRDAITKTQIEGLELVCPPSAVQLRFGEIAAQVERLRAQQRGSLIEFDALVSSLQDSAFRGQL